MKKLLSFVLCLITAFAVISGTVFGNSPADISIVSEAAKYNKTMLPYSYSKLTDEEKLAYLKLRTAFIDHKDSIKIEIPVETANKLSYIMMYADALTTFNFPVGDNVLEYQYYEDTELTSKIMFKYVYSKEEYDLIISKSDKAAKQVISAFSDKTGKYEKIKYIHDYIIENTAYVNNGGNSSAYDSLVKGEAKCDGYAHAFDYLCAKAGIRSVTVSGSSVNRSGEMEYHAWNKVYYNKKWYNVDVTWDDPESDLIENISYKYFMISDKVIGETHTQSDYKFYIPKAVSDDADYYKKHGLYASTLNEAKNIFADGIAEAAKDGRHSVTVKFADKSVYDKMTACLKDDSEFFDVMDRAGQKSGGRILTGGYLYEGDTVQMYAYTVYFFSPGTCLSDYYKDPKKLGPDMTSFLNDLGVKNA